MKAQDKAKLHQSSAEELTNKIVSLQKDLVVEKHNIKLGKQSNLKAAQLIRKQIAIIKTIMREKQIANETESV